MESALSPAEGQRRGILVLGMHRSGTSAIGRVLGLLGASLPSRTIGPDEFNEAGYWEAPELYRLHDQMLARAKSRWDDWGPFRLSSLDPFDVMGVKHSFVEFLAQEFRDSSLFVIKDPRICRFVPLWLDVFSKFSTAAGAIIPVRHPVAVARSLHARDGFSLSKSMLIWLRHVIDAEHATRCIPRSFVGFDALLTDWRSQLDRIGHELGMVWPNAFEEVADDVDRFLSVELRHHVATIGDLEGNPHVVSWIRRAYAAVQTLTQTVDQDSACRELDQVRSEFDNACDAFGDLWQESSSTVTAACVAPVGLVSKRDLDRNVERLERQFVSVNALANSAMSRMQAAESSLSHLEVATEHERSAAAEFRAEATEAMSRSLSAGEATADLRQRLEHLIDNLNRCDAAIKNLVAADHARDDDLDRQFAQLAEHALHRDAAMTDRVTKQDDRLAALTADLSRLAEHAIRRDAAIEDLAASQGSRFAELQKEVEQLAEGAARRESIVEDLAANAAMRHADLQRLVDVVRCQIADAQALRTADLEAAAAASSRDRDAHATTARHVDTHEARLSRLQYSLDGAIARLDALTAPPKRSRIGSTTKRVKDRLRGAGRRIERTVRKVRYELGRMLRLQSLRNYLARRHFRKTVRTIQTSGLFDSQWYLREYADVAATGVDPVLHYIMYGVREGRCPNPLFHTRWYLEQYPDVSAENADPLLHYLNHGAAEGRDPSPLFQTTAWLARHPELRSTKQNPLAHYLRQLDASPSGESAEAAVLPLCPTPTPTTLPTVDGPVGAPRNESFPYAPIVSIVVPVYNTPVDLLEKMVGSVHRQAYGNWELCLVDDASPEPHVRPWLERAAARDPRIRVTFRASNGNISAATNTGIAVARGDFIAFLDHDDELTPDALLEVVRLLNQEPDTDVVYSDQDKIDLDGRRSEPFYKPAWSPAYLESVMYVGHLLVVRASLLEETGGCDRTFDGVQDFELMLRLGEATKKIRHLPRILYHWRKIPGSIASDLSAKNGIVDLQRKAVQAHLDRIGIKAVATTAGTSHRVRVVPTSRTHEPLVSIMIPSKDHPELIGPCLESLFAKTTYKTFEVIVGDNESTDPEALRLFDRYPVTRVPLAGKFCFAAFNNRMAERARGDYLLLLNNDTEIVQPNWLETLMLYAEQDDVGAVGPLLLYGDGTVQHAGVILGPRGTADHVMRGFPGDSDGYAGSLQAAREVTAVTGACLLVRREHYMACGGLNETFGRHYEDVDFCLRLRRMGLRNIFAGSARMVHHESKSRGAYYDFTDRVLLLDHWESWIHRGDAYYNPAFDPGRVDYSVRVA